MGQGTMLTWIAIPGFAFNSRTQKNKSAGVDAASYGEWAAFRVYGQKSALQGRSAFAPSFVWPNPVERPSALDGRKND